MILLKRRLSREPSNEQTFSHILYFKTYFYERKIVDKMFYVNINTDLQNV